MLAGIDMSSPSHIWVQNSLEKPPPGLLMVATDSLVHQQDLVTPKEGDIHQRINMLHQKAHKNLEHGRIEILQTILMC
jgi:hypothetical protein